MARSHGGVARHYISLETLRRTLDAMGYFKLNVLHIHLSDDQAFRYSGTLFPEMASAEHYTASDLAALVAHAADRGVRIVPELDVPGHTTSWLVKTSRVGGPAARYRRRQPSALTKRSWIPPDQNSWTPWGIFSAKSLRCSPIHTFILEAMRCGRTSGKVRRPFKTTCGNPEN
ncbi:MAG: hypothetical protein CM1200mP9_01730 [Gammaproteobacteria bacterium]|nr:MAG: hypothetical protein CM1200mP9_01730 [Gammaproteobacteria bacterium]